MEQSSPEAPRTQRVYSPHLVTEPEQPAPHWDDMSAIEQLLMTRAAAEGILHEACSAWDQDPSRHSPQELDAILTAVWGLLRHNLIGMFRVADGYPDLSWPEIDEVFRNRRSHSSDRPVVGMYLTSNGEDLLCKALLNRSLVALLRFEPAQRTDDLTRRPLD